MQALGMCFNAGIFMSMRRLYLGYRGVDGIRDFSSLGFGILIDASHECGVINQRGVFSFSISISFIFYSCNDMCVHIYNLFLVLGYLEYLYT